LRLNFYVASILCLAGIAWFVRIRRAGAKSSTGTTVHGGGVLLAAGSLVVLTGCGQALHTNTARVQAATPAAHMEQRMPGRLEDL
jgi:hypothetical protein